MKIFRTNRDIRDHLKALNINPSGFVPTMGALHNGHISLVEKAMTECPVVTVSIFVNPTQFNDKEDLKNYPRTETDDLNLLSGVLRNNDAVFIPTAEEIYPEEDKRIFDFGNLASVMEGRYRPGHFNGVAQVVSRLFDIIRPDIACFGQKDLQQLIIIRELVRQTGNKVRIIACPIVRENDGLAMSSRNRLLDPMLRKNAGIIYTTISEASNMAGKAGINEIKAFVQDRINSTDGFILDYFEIVDGISLQPVEHDNNFSHDNQYFCCIAVKAGSIRLIDNIEISLV